MRSTINCQPSLPPFPTVTRNLPSKYNGSFSLPLSILSKPSEGERKAPIERFGQACILYVESLALAFASLGKVFDVERSADEPLAHKKKKKKKRASHSSIEKYIHVILSYG
jgi:hypothetical protein